MTTNNSQSSPVAVSRQSIISIQKRLSSGRRSVQTLGLGTAGGGGGGPGTAPSTRTRGGLARRHAPRLFVDGVDVTPRPLQDVGFGPVEERPPPSMGLDILPSTATATFPYMSLPMLGLQSAPSASSNMLATRESSMGASMGNWGMTPTIDMIPATSVLSVSTSVEDRAPSQFALPMPVSLKDLPPTWPLKITLKETPTFMLLDIPSTSVPIGSEEAQQALNDNERVREYRKTVHVTNSAEIQTAAVWVRSRSTLASRCKRKNTAVFASTWDLYDTQTKTEHPETSSLAPSIVTSKPQLEDVRLQRRRRMLRRNVLDRISSQRSMSLSDIDTKSLDSKEDALPPDDKTRALVNVSGFRKAALLLERVLASSIYSKKQLLYRGLPLPNPLSLVLRFEYRLEQLWIMESEWTNGRAVTCVSWSLDNGDLLAVGYGKYLHADKANGVVCVWCVKNPLLPERIFRFSAGVTALSFSSTRPNLLAVGFHDGSLALVDISAQDKNIVADAGDSSDSGRPTPSWEPIWSIVWLPGQEYHQDDDVLVTANQDGRIDRWRRDVRGLEWVPMMRVSRSEGGERGIAPLIGVSGAEDHDDPIQLQLHIGALCVTPVPNDPQLYIVGTEDGRVHTCSTNYLHRHLSVLTAHAGAVYRLSFSPFCDKIFLTCGADWKVRLWAVGINEPLVTLASGMQAVEDAAWSPTNSTIVASISGGEICIWDLRRKTYVPASQTSWPWTSPLTNLSFTTSQENLIVADREGRTVVFALKNMPFPPYYQSRVLAAALQRALATKPSLLALLNKMGSPFD